MNKKTISKLLATSIFAFAASASQAAPDVDVVFSWNTNSNTYSFQHGDYYPNESHEADTAHNNKYKMWNVAGEHLSVKNPPSSLWPEGDANVVRWGYGGWKKGKEIDFTRKSGSDDYRTSGLVLGGNTITYWNNFLDEDFYTPEFVTLNMTFDVAGVTVEDSLMMYFQRANEKEKKKGIDVDHGGSYLIFDANLVFTHTINGTTYEFAFADLMIKDYKGNDITNASLSTDCEYGLTSCYIVGGNVKSGSDNTKYVISFGNVTAVPEPETYAMLLAGLGIVGMVSRRRCIRN